MKAAYLDEAETEEVSRAVREVLDRRGALVHDHRHSRIRFTAQASTRYAWQRTGYVGIYQHVGEKDVEVRLLLRAKWPWRILLLVAAANLLAAGAVIALNPSGTVWVLVAALGFLALLVAFVLYVNTLKHVREEERALLSDMEAAFEARVGPEHVLTDEEREALAAEAALEGEVEAHLRRARGKAAPKGAKEPKPARERKPSRFSLRPRRAEAPPAPAEEPGETPEERRERLLARKAELERQRGKDG